MVVFLFVFCPPVLLRGGVVSERSWTDYQLDDVIQTDIIVKEGVAILQLKGEKGLK